MLNKVQLIGHLGRDPEVRHMQDGRPVVNLSIATSERWKDKTTNEPRERTEWHRVVIFNENLAGVAEKYLTKGARVFVEGQLQTRKWTDKENIERYSTEIVLQGFRAQLTMLDRRGEGSGERISDRNYDERVSQPSTKPATNNGATTSKPKFDDEIPF